LDRNAGVRSNIVYRDAVPEDALEIARVWVSAWQAAYVGLMPAEYLSGLDARAASPAFQRNIQDDLAALVVEVDRDIVGFTAFGPSRDEDAVKAAGEVIAINLHPSRWRQGIGRGLLQQTLKRLQQRGHAEATLWVLHGNAPARRFYEALGWTADGAEKRDDTLTGFPLHEVRYRMTLNEPEAE
jgi:GNAT superfamily N-acetyltransferase